MAAAGESPNRGIVVNGVKPDQQAVAIRCTTLADLLNEQRLETVDYLKMDIEGSEWEVLFSTPATVLRHFSHIQLEYHEANARFQYTPEKLIAHLASAGHRLVDRHEDAQRTGMASFQLV